MPFACAGTISVFMPMPRARVIILCIILGPSCVIALVLNPCRPIGKTPALVAPTVAPGMVVRFNPREPLPFDGSISGTLEPASRVRPPVGGLIKTCRPGGGVFAGAILNARGFIVRGAGGGLTMNKTEHELATDLFLIITVAVMGATFLHLSGWLSLVVSLFFGYSLATFRTRVKKTTHSGS